MHDVEVVLVVLGPDVAEEGLVLAPPFDVVVDCGLDVVYKLGLAVAREHDEGAVSGEDGEAIDGDLEFAGV